MIGVMQKMNTMLPKLLGKNYEEILGTFFLLLFSIIVYSVGFYIIKNRKWGTDKKRKTSINLRNTLAIIFIISALLMWSGEIKTMILSVAAISAAILIAFKEVLLCFIGSLLIASNKLFSLGEYIEIDGIKGKVIDRSFFYTKIILFEPFQTREMQIPNLLFINNKVINLSHYGKFQSYSLKLAVPHFSKVKIFSDEVEKLVDEALTNHKNQYSEYFTGKKMSDIFFDVPKDYYHIEYDLSDSKNAIIKLHYLAHPLDQSKIENTILRNYALKLEEEEINNYNQEIGHKNEKSNKN